MLVASGTFVAVDFGDAAIRSAILCGGSWEKFAAEMLLRINYPGIGRFVVALGVEGHMEFRRSKKRTERMALVTELLQVQSIKVFNIQKQMWIAADQAESTIENLYNEAERSYFLIVKCLEDNNDDYNSIENYEKGIVKNNPWIINLLK